MDGHRVRAGVHSFLILALLASQIAVVAVAFPTAGNGSFTLEQVLSAPFPSELVASPGGKQVAWIFNDQGRRNVWVAAAPSFEGRRLTAYDRDDGQEMTQPIFSPDGSWIAYVRGGSQNSAGETPNPTSDLAGARQEVWVVSTRTGDIQKLGQGSAPLFYPRGSRVLYGRDNALWVADIVLGGEKKLFEARGGIDSPVWSPDGALLAFVSSRDDHSYIALYDPASSRIRFLDASVDRDLAPRWSPDGARIAFVRAANVSNTSSVERERIVPWSIRMVDVASGKGHEIWKSGTSATESLSSVFGENLLQWASKDRLVFGSEEDGWARLYGISAGGGAPVALTPPESETESVAWAPDRSYLVISSNSGDIDRRHLWKISTTGYNAQPITRGRGIEMHPVVVDSGRRIAFLYADGRQPLLPHVAGLDGAGRRPLAAGALPAEFPKDHLVEPEAVVFKAADGMEIHGQLFRAKDGGEKRPAVIFMHGGPQRQMLLGWHYRGYYHKAYAFNQYLASRGYVVLSVNYRSGIGYGRAFREAKRRGTRGASEYQDIVAAGRMLRSRDDVDGKRIGLWGGSYGGYLTALGLARDSELFAAGVDLHGVHDWSARVGRGPAATGAGDLVRLSRESSPITAVETWKSPVLLIHGDDDRNVAFSQTVELVRKLREQGVYFEQLVFPDEVHDFLRHENWLKAFHASVDPTSAVF